jgi:endoglucanase
VSRLTICGVTLALAFGLSTAAAVPDAPIAPVRVDQGGYRPSAPKIAIAVGTAKMARAIVRPARGGPEVLTVPVGSGIEDVLTGDVVHSVDVSALKTPGSYVIEIPGVGTSEPFAIREDVYARPLYLATRAFYGQRCGTAVDLGSSFPGFTHGACHLDDAAFHPSSGRTGRIKAVGGWHDAGDYGKYVVNSGISTGELLWAWEWYPTLFRTMPLDIPESRNDTPDLLDEVRWNLDWMIAMQDDDGGVWPKLTSERFGSFTMPEQDDAGPRYIIGTGTPPYKSSCGTADFAAVAAIAARAFRPFDPAYADRTLAAARKAFVWLRANPDVRFRNPPDVSTGEYGDASCTDERLWAAAELLRTTGEEDYGAAARDLAAGFHVTSTSAQSWSSVANLGLWAYAWSKPSSIDGALRDRIAGETVAAGREIAERAATSPWRHSLTPRDFVWGSNGVVANYGVMLLAASRFEPDPLFVDAALDNLHYLLGRNTFGLSWVTDVGRRSFRHPHHRPSGSDANADPWPGLLSGGPNARAADPVMAKVSGGPPARRYRDDQGAYSANEIAINWNAPLVLLLAGLQAPR